MKQTIALQTPGRSDLDQSSLFSFDQFHLNIIES